jgi:uncharacterized protein (TIGR03083 family)
VAQLTAGRYFAQIESSTAAIAGLVGSADLSLPIPTCPEWTLRQLATHVGRAHRWAAAITSTRSAEFIPFRSVPDGRLPDDPAEHAGWLTAGAQRVIDAVRDAGQDRVWAFGGQVPAAFWGRRMCHETVVHAADAVLAAGQQPEIPAPVGADAIDEWLTLSSGSPGQPDPRAAALPQRGTLQVHATDDGLTGTSEWLVSLEPGRVSMRPEHRSADVTLAGPAASLLLVLLRRLPADDPAVAVSGDTGLLAGWLAATPF